MYLSSVAIQTIKWTYCKVIKQEFCMVGSYTENYTKPQNSINIDNECLHASGNSSMGWDRHRYSVCTMLKKYRKSTDSLI